MTERTACLNADENDPVEWGKMMQERKWEITPAIQEDIVYTSEDLGVGKFQIQIVLT